ATPGVTDEGRSRSRPGARHAVLLVRRYCGKRGSVRRAGSRWRAATPRSRRSDRCAFRTDGDAMDTTQLLKGVLDVAVLAVVAREDGYGYDVVRRLRAGGLDEVGEASVYGTLRRLYANGALTSYVVPSDEGPHRKYYGINAQGRAMLEAQRKDWESFSTTLSALLDTEGAAR